MKAAKPMQTLEEALAQLLAAVSPLTDQESVPTLEADGRVLAQDLLSPLDVPGFDNAQMDGYALRSADVPQPGTVLPVAQRIPAGHFGTALAPQSAARIFTGAPMPAGADCVVMQEDCELVDQREDRVRINTVPRPGQWVRHRGEDVERGAVALRQGQRLDPAALGLAASLGMSQLPVTRRTKVALLSTGDELVMPGEVAPQDLKPGAIYNSNRFFLHALLKRAGCEVSDLGIVPDERAATIQVLQAAALSHDVILTSGGVSVGEADHIKPAVQELGSLDLWSISIKPGKPFAYGRIHRDTDGFAHFIGLPGNPVSSFVTFLLLVRPLLAKLQGQTGDLAALAAIPMRADFSQPKPDPRREFLRVRRNAQGGLDVFPNQNSSVLTSLVWADGLVVVPAGTTITPGQSVNFIPWSSVI